MLEQTIWWHLYPLGAVGAPIRGEHGDPEPRLRKLDAWLDYAVELGCNGLLLNPIFASASHGYDTLDYYRIDPRLGGDEDFDHLIAEAGRRGMGVVLDGVFNHVSRHHPLVADRPDMVKWDGDHPRGWEGHGDLVELDHENPDVANMVVDVMLHWLRRGIAGWRLDVAYAVPTWFWRDVAQRVRAEFADVVLLGEVIHGDYPRFVEESTLTTVTQYELWKALWSSAKDRNAWELAHAIERHDAFSRSFLPNTFSGNHDVSRLASVLEPRQVAMMPYLLMALPGVPSIYYGDEQGFTGVKTEAFHGDDEVRAALPASPAELSTLGQDLFRHYQAAIGFRRRHPWLATASVEVVHKTNDELTLRCSNGGHELFVDANIATGAIQLRAGDESVGVG